MAIEDIWFNINYKLPCKVGKYIVKEIDGCEYICFFTSTKEWIEKFPSFGYFVVRKDVIAWKYINYE